MAKTKKTKKPQPDEPKRKPGNQGNFTPEETAFLESHFPAYYAINGTKTTFWNSFFPQFFEKFPFIPPDSADSEKREDHDANDEDNDKADDGASGQKDTPGAPSPTAGTPDASTGPEAGASTGAVEGDDSATGAPVPPDPLTGETSTKQSSDAVQTAPVESERKLTLPALKDVRVFSFPM